MANRVLVKARKDEYTLQRKRKILQPNSFGRQVKNKFWNI